MKRVFVISDIHGCFNTFYELVIKEIDLHKDDRLVLLGDYIDRGEESREVIDFIIDLIETGFDIIPLRGNHEQMLLDAYNETTMQSLWFMNSGMTTLASFEIGDISELDGKYIDFFTSLEYYLVSGNMIFVHAGFNDKIADPFTDVNTMIWECSREYTHNIFKGKTIIHGHRPRTIDDVIRLLSKKSNVIPVDTGCVYERELGYGNLSALEIGTMTLYSVPNIQKAL